MEKFISEIGSIYWWTSVFAVGIIINIIAGFSTKYIDNFLTEFSNKRQTKKSQEKIEQKAQIEELRQDDVEKVIQSSLILFLRMKVNTYLLITVIYFILTLFLFSAGFNEKIPTFAFKIFATILLLISCISMFLAWKYMRLSSKENKILWEARMKDKKNSVANNVQNDNTH